MSMNGILNAAMLSLLLFSATAAAAAPAASRPKPVAEGVAHSIVDGDTLVLDGGTQVRLVGIQAPKLPLGRPNFTPWPLAGAAKDALERLALGKTLSLRYGGRRVDRHGRLLAHLFTEDGLWIQGTLLREGMARVYTFSDNRGRAAEMLALEAAARKARRGIWAHPFYRILTVAEAHRFIDTFQLVEGQVLETAVVRGRAYFNFGRDWRRDFTITVSPRNMRRFRSAGHLPSGYRGKRVRVRGWLKSYNGPMIEATHPEQIELLDR